MADIASDPVLIALGDGLRLKGRGILKSRPGTLPGSYEGINK